MTCEHRATKEVCCDCGEDLEYDGPAELRRLLAEERALFRRTLKELNSVSNMYEKSQREWETRLQHLTAEKEEQYAVISEYRQELARIKEQNHDR